MKKKEITHFPRQRQEDGERPMEKGAKLPAVRRCRDAFRYVSLFARGGGRAMSGVASCFFFTCTLGTARTQQLPVHLQVHH